MFDAIINIFNIILYKPLFNLLVLLYNYIPGKDFGLAIIFLTLIIRILLYPLSVKAVNSQKALQKLQPKIQEAQRKYKDDKEKQAKEVLEIYKTEKINPFSGLFLAMIQFPILIALYNVFWQGLNPKELTNLYSFVSNPININSFFLGMVDLSKPNLIFAITAGILQYFQTKMLTPKTAPSSAGKNPDFSQMMQKQMLYFFPILTMIILLGLPSALGLYWIISGLFSIIQQYFILKKTSSVKQ
jgi:YidC/Oxa1 family membrane protein insertase